MLGFVFERTLRQLHPFVPHVTEELWQALPHEGELLALAPWPSPEEAPTDGPAVAEMEIVLDAIRALRNLRTETETPAPEQPPAAVRAAHAEADRVLRAREPLVRRLARVASLAILPADGAPPARSARAVTVNAEYFLERPAETPGASESLARERAKLVELLEKARRNLSDEGFRSKAPAHVVAEAEAKASELEERIKKIDGQPGRSAPESA